MDPITLAAIIGGGAGLLSGGLNLMAQGRQRDMARRNLERTINARKNMALNEHQRNIEMWEMMKEYNSPKMQMQRFQEAGLNPNLIYGQGTPGNVQQIPEYQRPRIPQANIPAINPGQAFDEAISTFTDVRRTRANVRQTEVSTAGQIIQNSINTSLKDIKIKRGKLQLKREQQQKVINTIRTKIERKKSQWYEEGITPNDSAWMRGAATIINTMGWNSDEAIRNGIEWIKNNLGEIMQNLMKNNNTIMKTEPNLN